MNEPTPLEQQRERTISALIDEQYAHAIAKGSVIRNPPAWRAAKRADIVAQARENPGWLRQQSDRIFGEQKRPGRQIECAWCDITFNPQDEETVRGPDGRVYCRQSCARQEPFVSLDDYLRVNPHLLDAGTFARLYADQTKTGKRLNDLQSIALAPPEADVDPDDLDVLIEDL